MGAELPAVQRGRVMVFIRRESNAKEQVRYKSSEQKKERQDRNVEMLSPGTDPHNDE